MLCESCGKNAARHRSTDIVNNVKSVRHLCDACFKNEGKDSPFSQLTLSGFLTLKTNLPPELKFPKSISEPGLPTGRRSQKHCEACGLDLETLQKTGTIGCPADYEIFAEEIGQLLLRLHGARVHVGRLPKDFQNRRAREHQAQQLEAELEKAVHDERFEEAARLRDRIRALRKEEPEKPVTEGRSGHDG